MDLKERLDRFTEDVEIRYLLAGLLIVVGLALVSAVQLVPSQGQPQNQSVSGELEINLTLNYTDSVTSEIAMVENGTTVFQLLNTTQEISYSKSQYGYFITAINNRSGTESQYWTYTVNGESAKVGVGQYKLNRASNVTFTLS